MAVQSAWLAWAVSWIVAALWADRVAKRPGFFRELRHYSLEILGFILLLGIFGNRRTHGLLTRLWSLPPVADWVLLGIVIFGFAFAWWARAVLGRLWSGRVTRKADHHIVQTGPYAVVRHPIYTGLLISAFATVAIKGTAIAAAGGVILLIGWIVKARLEERFLREELGEEAYDAYRRRVPMLVPFGPKSA